MSHPAQVEWCEHVKELHRWAFMPSDDFVLDVGSLDINGSNRGLFQTGMESGPNYIGADVAPGPNVDIVGACHTLTFRDAFFDVIISTEAFEHDAYLPFTLRNIVRMLASGGLFVFTCATTGRDEHGTIICKPHDAPGLPWWHYRNVTEAHVRLMIDVDAIFSSYEFNALGEDLRFWGIKR